MRPYNALINWGELDMYITPDGEKLGAANASRLAFNADREFVDAPAKRSRVQFTRTGDQKVIAHDGPADLTDRGARTVFIAGSPARTFIVLMCR